MNMKEFNGILPIKFLIVLGKMHASIFGKVEKHIKELGLNTTEFLILYTIAANGALTIQDIGSRIFMTSGNMTYTIDKLEKRDLIKRVRCDEDRRRIFIDFTTTGKAMWKDVMEAHKDFMEKTFDIIDEAVIEQTIENMKVIGKTIEDYNH